MGLNTEKLIINGVEYDLTSNNSGSDINIIDNLESTDTESALSAKQGKILNDKVEEIKSKTVVAEYDEETETLDLEFNVPTQGIIEDTLNSDNKYNALSANQGKNLNEKITDNVNAINDINSSLLSLIAMNEIYIKAVPNQGAKTKLIIKCTNAEQILLYIGAGTSGSSHVLVLAPTQSGTLGYKSLGGTNLVPVIRDDKNIEIPTGNWARGFILSYANFDYYSE